MPQIHVKYLLFIKITNLATEGALSLIYFFLFITNCHKLTYSCLLEFLLSKERREGNVIFSAFVSLEDPFPPKNSLSQRSRLLRIQHWDVIFTYKQNKHLAATDFGRIWAGDVTSLLEARLDHNMKRETSYLPRRLFHEHVTAWPWHVVTAAVCGHFFYPCVSKEMRPSFCQQLLVSCSKKNKQTACYTVKSSGEEV